METANDEKHAHPFDQGAQKLLDMFRKHIPHASGRIGTEYGWSMLNMISFFDGFDRARARRGRLDQPDQPDQLDVPDDDTPGLEEDDDTPGLDEDDDMPGLELIPYE